MLTRENGMDRYEQPEAMEWAGMKAQELEGKGMDNQEMKETEMDCQRLGEINRYNKPGQVCMKHGQVWRGVTSP